MCRKSSSNHSTFLQAALMIRRRRNKGSISRKNWEKKRKEEKETETVRKIQKEKFRLKTIQNSLR